MSSSESEEAFLTAESENEEVESTATELSNSELHNEEIVEDDSNDSWETIDSNLSSTESESGDSTTSTISSRTASVVAEIFEGIMQRQNETALQRKFQGMSEDQIMNLMTSDSPDEIVQFEKLVKEAISCDRVELFEYLLEKGYTICASQNFSGGTAIHYAFNRKSEKILELASIFFQCKEDMNYTDDDGFSHLHIACIVGNLEAVQHFVMKGEDLKKQCQKPSDISGCTPLHLAAMHGHLKIVECLLEGGADVAAVDNFGRIPLHLACQVEKTWKRPLLRDCDDEESTENISLSIVDVLLKFNSDLNALDGNLLTPLCYTVDDELYDVFKFQRDSHCMAMYYQKLINRNRNKQNEKLKLLLDNGADASLGKPLLRILEKMKNTRSPDLLVNILLDDSAFTEMARMLLEKGANVNSTDQNGQSLLQLAISNLSVGMVRVLLDYRAHVDNVKFHRNCFNYPSILPRLNAVENLLDIITLVNENGLHLSLDDDLSVMQFFIANDNYDPLMGKGNSVPNGRFIVNNLFYYGTSICIERNIKRMKKNDNYKFALDGLIFSLQDLRLGNFYVDKETRKIIRQINETNCMKLFDHLCDRPRDRQIKRMQETVLYDEKTLYHIMKQNPHEMYPFLRNGAYRKILHDPDFVREFISLGEAIQGHIAKSLIRHYIAEAAINFLKLLDSVSLPNLCCAKIIDHLSNEDVLHVCIAAVVDLTDI